MEIVHQDMYRYQFHPTTLVVTTLDRGSESDDEVKSTRLEVVWLALWRAVGLRPNQHSQPRHCWKEGRCTGVPKGNGNERDREDVVFW